VTFVTEISRQPRGSWADKKLESRKICYVVTLGVTIIFEWDAAKNRANRRKHGLDFADAEELFGGVLLVSPDTRLDYAEKR
jgi:Ribonuclease toxin, BrnT, of type II toxin-antitoxin system